jgi:Icc-related predicted phosphoesterase
MRRLLLCSGIHGSRDGIERLRRLAAERRPEAILFAGGVLSPSRDVVPCETTEWGVATEDERFVHDFYAALGGLGVFTAVIPGPDPGPLDEFYRLALAAELESPNVRVVHATLVEVQGLALSGLGVAIAEPPLMREDCYSRVRARYFLRSLRASEKPRKALLLPDPPPGALGGPEGNVEIGELIDWLRPGLCVVAGRTERRGLQRVAGTLVVNPGCLAEGSAAWLDWDRISDDQVEFLSRE